MKHGLLFPLHLNLTAKEIVVLLTTVVIFVALTALCALMATDIWCRRKEHMDTLVVLQTLVFAIGRLTLTISKMNQQAKQYEDDLPGGGA